ncbi:MAG TPA: MBL fold metallo-hydrolase [Woeseiaceae bacterium]|nr:MBL fold metallo-hydrolase [Woeseiaceae bacterium]
MALMPILSLAVACAHASVTPSQLTVPYPADTIVLPEDGYLYEARQIAPCVYTLQSPEAFHYQPLGNVTAIEQEDGFVLVDAGGSRAAAERIIALLRQINAEKPVTAVVITHWHGDHVLGLRRLLDEWPQARTISTVATRRALLSEATLSYVPTTDTAATERMLAEMHRGGDHFASRSNDPDLPEDVRIGYARASRVMHQHARDLATGSTRLATSETFTERLRIDDRGTPVEILFLGRANTDGDAVAWLPRQRILISGDIVVAPMPYGFSSYPGEWLEVLRRLRTFDFEWLVPGHGHPMRDTRYIDRLSALIADVRSQMGVLAARELPLEEIRKQVDLSSQQQSFAGADRWRRLIFDYYWTEPIVRSAYREAQGETILQGDHPE